jgi:hypothetical protein
VNVSTLLFVDGPLDGQTREIRGIEPPVVQVPVFVPREASPFRPSTYDPTPIEAVTYRRRTIQYGLRTVFVYLPVSVSDGDVMHVMRRTKSGRRIISEVKE